MERQEYYEEPEAEESEYEEEEEGSPLEESEIIESEGEEDAPTSYSHESEDEEGEEEEEDEAPRKKGRLPGNARIQQVTREKYQALNELSRMQQENEFLKRRELELGTQITQSGNAAMIFYDKSANLKLEHAKAKKFQAAENGDIQAGIDADVEMATATHELQQINYWKAQQASEERNRQLQYEQQSQYSQQQPAAIPQADPQESYDWVERNTWFNPGSADFSPELAQAARDYSEKVENLLYREGRPDLIMSKQYYDEIDNHISQLKNQRGQGMRKNQLNMRPVRGGAAPVRNSGQSSRGTEKHALSRAEKEIASVMGIKEKDYLSNKLRDQQENPQYWNNGGQGNGRKGYY